MNHKRTKRGARSRHPTNRRISVRSVQRRPADYRKLARVLIALAQAEAEAENKSSGSEDRPPKEAA